MDISLHQLACQRCRHRWFPRRTEVRVCPKCHSPYWDRSRAGGASQIAETPARPYGVGVQAPRIEKILKEMVRRIVKACDPQKIILFGSHATGRAGPGSDVDLLVVTEKGESTGRQAMALYDVLWDAGVAKDIVVVRPDYFDRYKNIIGTVIYPAAHEGRTLYERAA